MNLFHIMALATLTSISSAAFAESSFEAFTKPSVIRLDTAASNPISIKGPAVIQFWASWCVGCRKTMETVLETIKAGKVQFLTVSLDDDPALARKYLERAGPLAVSLQASTVVDTKQEIGAEFKISSVPTLLFIDAGGHIVARAVGHTSAEDIHQHLNQLTKKVQTSVN